MNAFRHQAGDQPVQLRPLGTAEAEAIAAWPRYGGELAPLDYALRPGGWLDMFPESPANRRFAVWRGPALVGFALLVDIDSGRAEFYIALHPHELGRGLGGAVTARVLDVAFDELHLDVVYLKVRTWHRRGIALYRRLGFVTVGETDIAVQGSLERFFLMEIKRSDTQRPATTENGAFR